MAASDSWQRFERCRQHKPPPFSLYTLQSSLRGRTTQATAIRKTHRERERVLVLQGPKEKEEALFVISWGFSILDFFARSSNIKRSISFTFHMTTVSSVFGISAADIERRLPEFIPQRRALACYVSSIIILMIIFMKSRFFLPNFPEWLFLGVLLMAAIMIRYASFQQHSHRTQAQAPQDELSGQQVEVPTFVTREQLPDIRIQLAHLNREFDDSDYDAFRALDEDINPNIFALSEEEVNAIPIYKYQVQSHPHSQKAEDCSKIEGSKFEENELTCSICMEQVNEEELIRRLHCSHEFHASCIFPWLRQHGTCPICKHRAG